MSKYLVPESEQYSIKASNEEDTVIYMQESIAHIYIHIK